MEQGSTEGMLRSRPSLVDAANAYHDALQTPKEVTARAVTYWRIMGQW